MKDLPDNRLGDLGTKLTLSGVNECALTKLCRLATSFDMGVTMAICVERDSIFFEITEEPVR